jgi:hypothetical protein
MIDFLKKHWGEKNEEKSKILYNVLGHGIYVNSNSMWIE